MKHTWQHKPEHHTRTEFNRIDETGKIVARARKFSAITSEWHYCNTDGSHVGTYANLEYVVAAIEKDYPSYVDIKSAQEAMRKTSS